MNSSMYLHDSYRKQKAEDIEAESWILGIHKIWVRPAMWFGQRVAHTHIQM